MIYLDNSATTKPYKEALESYLTVSSEYFGNPSSIHSLGSDAEKLLQRSRDTIADLLNVAHNEIIFTSGGTESNNLAIRGCAIAKKNIGKHLITTAIEHPSVIQSFSNLEQEGFHVTVLPVDREGRVSVSDVESVLTQETTLVSIMHVNNETGVIQPVEEIAKMLTNYPNIDFHVDHIQGVGKVPLNLENIDFCSFSAHKFHGLKGNGLLVVKSDARLYPILNGGEQEWKLRAGTENVAGIVAMTKALRMTLEAAESHRNEWNSLKSYCMTKLAEMEGVHINTPKVHTAPHIINFSVPGIKSEVLVHALGSKKIYLSTTSACSSRRKAPSKTLTAMGAPSSIADSSIRLSMSHRTTMDEIEMFLTELKSAIITIKDVTR
ncbi:cysteine desulfurase family protein [Sutcliffiella rhizosphaerae]|uniref:Cysteine desulfurase IscS n=1 Tax=Sutcliffiella rhizosphaerae TaxID=2880967 RepID=A0ABM8YTQ6_9BACI|nr:cysteine desulfurase family protein [Sutcliffiella rhizosphaerae]CAG9623354.1 Cysteine desulfurase IscS [Sutcliffiella rhizosphaerae]